MRKIGKFYRICFSLILVLVIVYLASRVDFIFRPIRVAIDILTMPLLFTVFFYYLLRPLVGMLGRFKLKKPLAILMLYAALAGLFTLFFFLVWPTLRQQTIDFANSLPGVVLDVREQLLRLQDNELVRNVDLRDSDLTSRLSDYVSDLVDTVSTYISSAVSFFTTLVIVVSTVPILLYYMLKEDKSAYRSLMRHLPSPYKREVRDTLLQIDRILSEFILGRVILCFLLGVMIYAGFLIIDLPYSLLLALLLAVLNLIPYIGQFIGMIPALTIAFIDSPTSIIWVLLIVNIAQQIEGNLLSPHIYGRKLDIHPMMTIVLLLIAGSIGGIIGIMIAIPVYLIGKVIAIKLYRRFVMTRPAPRTPAGPAEP
ncbi:AI-2E family transporter [Paenibacillus sp. IB182496]|uniref:AI-2E family transporter n=1 Tax=Paenibacillus sabuli TaxID=2772509 RepID=A0A927BWU9_9BACL|nr:AI-2E family transporter [Paenibacillus sabuli]MBD2846964.1 AI-2E family transporter [Paenibacillus sabuli]